MLIKSLCVIVVLLIVFFKFLWQKKLTKPTIAIIAIKSELEPLIQLFKRKKTSRLGSIIVYITTLNHYKLVLVESGVGSINAAIATTLMIENYDPDYIITLGTAGSVKNEINPQDIVICTSTSFHDVDLTAFNLKYGQIPGLPVNFDASSYLLEKIRKMSLDIKPYYGLIVSGDSFIDDQDEQKFLLDKFPNTLAVDMETAAIGQISYIFKIPFIGIRVISDHANDSSPQDYDNNVVSHSFTLAKITFKILNDL